jgi:osmotically-inducible protein OsmY
VVDARRLPGTASSRALPTVLVSKDAAIAAPLSDDLPAGPLWTDTTGVHVTVSDGVVTLSGQMARGEDARVIARMAGRVNGVVDLVNELVVSADVTVDPSKRA